MMGGTSAQRRTIRFAHNMIQWIEWCVLMELWLLHWVYIDLIAPKMKYICNNNFTGLKTSLFFSLMMRLISNVYFGDWNRQQCSHLSRTIRLKMPPQLIIIQSFFSRLCCFGSFFFYNFYCCFQSYWRFWTMNAMTIDMCTFFYHRTQCNLKQNWKISTFHTFYSFISYLLFDSISSGWIYQIKSIGCVCTHYE